MVSIDTTDAGHSHGDHRYLAYRGQPQRVAAARAFFTDGASSDEKLVYVSPDASNDPVIPWLTGEFDPDRVMVSEVAELYPASSTFDATATVAGFVDLLATARSDGFSTLRCMADLTRLAENAVYADDLLAYELLIDHTIEDEGLHGFCSYDARVVGHRAASLAAAHPAPAGDPSPTASLRGDVLRLGGELDLAGADSIAHLLANAPRHVGRVSLDGLDFLDVSGASALARFAGSRRASGVDVRFEGASRSVQTVLEAWDLVS